MLHRLRSFEELAPLNTTQRTYERIIIYQEIYMSGFQSSSTDSIRVSPRHLGQMRRPDFCPHCFWYSVALGFRHPFDMSMPGILFNMDRFEKILVQAHFAAKRSAPKWLTSLGCTGPVSFPRKMTEELPNLGLTLVGMPDEVLRKKDGSLCLIDYKTAKFKGEDDPFMPIYECQLWGYARLLEHEGVGTVSSAALVYFANTLHDYSENSLDLLTTEGISVPFEVKIHEVKLDLKALNPLLKMFRAYADMAAPPEGIDKCKTCKRLDVLFDIEQGMRRSEKGIKNLQNLDNALLYSQQLRWRSEQRIARAFESSGWESMFADSMPIDADSIPAAWDH
jgi:PD-(D/E)XK nuclease superfamily